MIGRRHSLSTSSRIRKVNHERLIVLIVLGSRLVHWAEHVMKLGIELY